MFDQAFSTIRGRFVARRVLAAALVGASAWGMALDASAQDTTPDVYNFVNKTVTEQLLVRSDLITIAGIDAPASLSLSGHSSARFIINDGSPQSGTTTVNNGDSVRLSLVSRASPGSRSATVDIGGVTDVWKVVTVLPDTTPQAFDFVDKTVDSGKPVQSNSITVRGINAPTTLTLTGHASARFKINGGALQSGSGTVNNGDTIRLRLFSSTAPGSRSATLDIGGVTETWTVTTTAVTGCGSAFDPAAFGDQDGDGKPETAFTFTVDGVARAAAIRFPAAYDNNSPHALVFEFHGDQERGTDGLAVSAAFDSGVLGANEYGNQAIVVALRGENLLAPEVRADFSEFVSWNTLSPPAENNDIKAVLALRDTIAGAACVDPDRVFAAGFSGGGFLANTLRCFGVPLRATAQFQSGIEGQPQGFEFLRDDAGNPLVLDPQSCVVRQAPVLVVHGTADTTVNPAQGEFAAQHWAGMNACDTSIDNATASSLDAECVEFAGCGTNAVAYCRPDGVAHEVWGQGAGVINSFFGRFFQ